MWHKPLIYANVPLYKGDFWCDILFLGRLSIDILWCLSVPEDCLNRCSMYRPGWVDTVCQSTLLGITSLRVVKCWRIMKHSTHIFKWHMWRKSLYYTNIPLSIKDTFYWCIVMYSVPEDGFNLSIIYRPDWKGRHCVPKHPLGITSERKVKCWRIMKHSTHIFKLHKWYKPLFYTNIPLSIMMTSDWYIVMHFCPWRWL